MRQSRIGSAFESYLNVFIGYFVSVITWHIVGPLFGYDVTPHDSFSIALIFSLVSFARAYCMRRLFNWWQHR